MIRRCAAFALRESGFGKVGRHRTLSADAAMAPTYVMLAYFHRAHFALPWLFHIMVGFLLQ